MAVTKTETKKSDDKTSTTAHDKAVDAASDSQAANKQKAKDAVDAIQTETDPNALVNQPHDEPGPYVEESQKRMVPPEVVQGVSTPSAIEEASKGDLSDSELQEAVNDWARGNFRNVETVSAIREPDILRVEMRTIHGTSKDAVEGVKWSKAGVKKALDELQKKMKG